MKGYWLPISLFLVVALVIAATLAFDLPL